MANWTNPIYDRTKEDVDYAKSQIAYIKANNGIMSSSVYYKGCLNFRDVNRIENNTKYLADHYIISIQLVGIVHLGLVTAYLILQMLAEL